MGEDLYRSFSVSVSGKKKKKAVQTLSAAIPRGSCRGRYLRFVSVAFVGTVKDLGLVWWLGDFGQYSEYFQALLSIKWHSRNTDSEIVGCTLSNAPLPLALRDPTQTQPDTVLSHFRCEGGVLGLSGSRASHRDAETPLLQLPLSAWSSEGEFLCNQGKVPEYVLKGLTPHP